MSAQNDDHMIIASMNRSDNLGHLTNLSNYEARGKRHTHDETYIVILVKAMISEAERMIEFELKPS